MLAACAVVGSYTEPVRVEYANSEWRRNFWKLWMLKEKHGGQACSDPLPDEVLSMDIWTLHY